MQGNNNERRKQYLAPFRPSSYTAPVQSFQKIRDMYRLQREAKTARKALRAIHIEAEGKWAKVVVNGEQEVLDLVIVPDAPNSALAVDLRDVLNRALKKAQIVAAEKMQGVMKEAGLPTTQ